MLATAVTVAAIDFTYSGFDKGEKSCTLTGWEGHQPSNGVLEIPESHTMDGVEYRVTSIAPHALDNLTTVTSIFLPSGITAIGELSCTGSITSLGALMNFNNCPNLTRFGVATANPGFDASPVGELRCLKKTILVKVPSKVVTDNGGRFDVSPLVTSICEDAFTGNTTIKTLGLPPKLSFGRQYPGYGGMTKLQEFTVSGSETPLNFTIDNGIVYSKDMTALIAFPPCKTWNGITLPEGVKKIGDKAFANTVALYRISLPESLAETGREAFAGSGITDITIPAKVTNMAQGAFRGCSRLASITINSHSAIPADFARDCKMLTRVDAKYPPLSLGDNAFKNCPRLESFPFSGATNMEGDSIFAGCAFREVVFLKSVTSSSRMELGDFIFADNPMLERIDMSAIDTESAADSEGISVGVMIVSNCPELKTVSFPPSTSFKRRSSDLLPTFGIDSPVEKIILSSFGAMPSADILYYSCGTHTPKIYMLTSDTAWHRWPLEYFFSTANQAICTPAIYCESYSMEIEEGHRAEYAVSGASYHIPGGTLDQYRYAREKGSGVTEMFGFHSSAHDGNLSLDITGNLPGLTFSRVTVNAQDVGLPDASGKLKTTIPIGEVGNVTVEYTLDDVAMKTIYPGNFFKAAIEGTNVDTGTQGDCGIHVNGRVVTFGSPASYTIHDMQGRVVAAGSGLSADLSPLPRGLYIISARQLSGESPYANKKINLL